MIIGKFHGMIPPHTPIGSRSVKMNESWSDWFVSPKNFVGQPA
jgi:hypothetical protein